MNEWNFSGDLTPDQWSLVYKDGLIVYFGQENVSTTCNLFIGTKEECETEISKLGLTTQKDEQYSDGLDIT